MKLSLVIIAFATVYAAAAAVPMETFWFDPGTPVIRDAVVGSDPELVFSRNIKRDALIQYSLLIRSAADNHAACDAVGGPFTYRKHSGPLIGKTLGWWGSSDPRCGRLPVGAYYGQVTWTAVAPLGDLLPEFLRGPLGWLLPPKRVSREIMIFNILPEGDVP